MNVKIKKINDKVVIPKYSRNGDAGLDLTAVSISETEKEICYGTGIIIEIPEGFAGLLLPRSSLSKYDLMLSNHVGLIDSNYRGEILLKFKKINKAINLYKVGDRIAQLLIIPYPNINIIETDNLSETSRGTDGFGSSGK